MKFLQIHTFYDQYLADFYGKRPELSDQPHENQIDALLLDGFSGNHVMVPYLKKYGWDTRLIVPNCRQAQLKWAATNGLTVREGSWMHQIVMAQIESFKPDIIYCPSPLDFDSHFMRLITVPVKLIVGWRAAEIPAHTDFSDYDLMLSSDPYSRQTLLDRGVRRVEHFAPGFPRFIAEKLSGIEKRFDVMFTGQYGRQHERRNQLLEDIVSARSNGGGDFSISYYLARADNFPLAQSLAPVTCAPCFGMEMYTAIRQGRIALNAVIDFAKGEAGNMRQFEITGAGSFMLTEHHEKLEQYFSVGTEIESYRSSEDLVEKIRYYLDHPAKREEIARKGQERCLREHSMEVRAEVFKEILEKELRADTRARRRSEIQEAKSRISANQTELSKKVSDALELIKSGNAAVAYETLNQAGQGKAPVRDFNFVLALALLQLQHPEHAVRFLTSEVREFPDNSIALQLLRDITVGA